MPNANAQSYAGSKGVALIRAKLQDVEIVLFNDDSYITVHFAAETEVAKLFKDGNEVFEDAEWNQYVNKNGKWFKMDMGIFHQIMILTNPIPPYKKNILTMRRRINQQSSRKLLQKLWKNMGMRQ